MTQSAVDKNYSGDAEAIAWLALRRALAAIPASSGNFAAVTDVTSAAFGAVGNGVANDTAAINLAIASINAGASPPTLYFPEGQYLVTSSLSTPANNTYISGPTSGTYTAQPKAQIVTPDDIPIFSILDTISLTFDRIGFLCTNVAPTQQAITLIDSPYCTFSGVAIQGFGYGLVLDHVALASSSSFATTLNSCNFISNATTNIYAKQNSSANALVIINSQFGGASQNGIVFYDSDNLVVIGGGCENTALLAIDIDNSNVPRLQCGDVLIGVHFEYAGVHNPATAMVRVGNTGICDGGSIIGCIFVTNNNLTPGPPILFTSPTRCPQWTYQGCSFQGFTPIPAGQAHGIVSTSPVSAPRKVTNPAINAAYTIDSVEIDDIVTVSSAIAPVTITLPPPAYGITRTVVDVGGAASGRPITIKQNAAEVILGTSIAGVTSVTLPGDWSSLTFSCLDGTDWWVLDSTFNSSVGQVTTRKLQTTANGQVATVNVLLPNDGPVRAKITVQSHVTVAGATSLVGDAFIYEGIAAIKMIGGVATLLNPGDFGTLNPTGFLSFDASQATTSEEINPTFSGAILVLDIEQSGAPNVGATIQWTVSIQVIESGQG